MKRRGKRIAIGVMASGLAVLLVLAIAHWKTVRDHVEAWHFQLTRNTQTIMPDPRGSALLEQKSWRFNLKSCLFVLATSSGFPVIVDAAVDTSSALQRAGVNPFTWALLAEDSARRGLLENGWHVLEQRFPRRAYLVIRDERYDAQVRAILESSELGEIRCK